MWSNFKKTLETFYSFYNRHRSKHLWSLSHHFYAFFLLLLNAETLRLTPRRNPSFRLTTSRCPTCILFRTLFGSIEAYHPKVKVKLLAPAITPHAVFCRFVSWNYLSHFVAKGLPLGSFFRTLRSFHRQVCLLSLVVLRNALLLAPMHCLLV